VRAFIGHGNNAYSAAYPYESVYTSEKRLMMQDARDEVLAIYRSCHLDKAASWKENEDHIAVETRIHANHVRAPQPLPSKQATKTRP
jgi:TorA maturation chaperone TorD